MWGILAFVAAIHVYESKQTAVTEGDVVLATDPDTAYRATTDYARWSQIFKNVRHAFVKAREGDDARVAFVHDDGSTDLLHFRNRSATHTMWFEQIGGDAQVWAETTFAPGDEPGTTHVHTRFYADVHGAASWFVSDAKIRRLREKQVRDDLTQLQAYFARK